jgi:hypothetical protein
MEKIWDMARAALEQNRVTSSRGSLLLAGAHQFKTYWVRDFCYSLPALLRLGAHAEVRGQLEIALENLREDGLIARGFDVVNPKRRVLAESLDWHFLIGRENYQNSPLQAEFLGEHGTPAMDSNLLILWGCLYWTEATGDFSLLQAQEARLRKTYAYVKGHEQKGLLHQPAFSDWQDSARRKGITSYLNLWLLRLQAKMQDLGVDWGLSDSLDENLSRFWHSFYDPEAGLFRHRPVTDAKRRAQFPLEVQLAAVEDELFKPWIATEELWENLLRSPLWASGPGRPIWPCYPVHEISWTTRLAGLRHYHDGFSWSWLVAEALKIAYLREDAGIADRLLGTLEEWLTKFKSVHEIYEFKKEEWHPVRRPFYRAEVPFSWGAAKILEALSAKCLIEGGTSTYIK